MKVRIKWTKWFIENEGKKKGSKSLLLIIIIIYTEKKI
jgi:hypothetical protein